MDDEERLEQVQALLDELNDMARVVIEYAKKQGHGTGHQNRW